MLPKIFSYVAVIVSEFVLVVGLVWYVMHLLDTARRERRRRHHSPIALSSASASCDLAALASRLAQFGADEVDPGRRPARGQVQQQEQA